MTANARFFWRDPGDLLDDPGRPTAAGCAASKLADPVFLGQVCLDA
ncbi:hypothetical protein [Polyangium sp. 6x1]|nr:hypothetical protein [Polyangium sp. 6x1]MDI1445968.1 hypothetical protein [Polyangium sp. 6x1]